MTDHLLDGALAHAASFLGLATLAASFGRADRRALALVGAVLLAVAVLLHLEAATVAFTGDLAPGGALAVLGGTTYGRSLAVHALGAAAAVGCRRRPAAAWAATGASLVGFVWIGHGGAQGNLSGRALLTLVHVGALLGWLTGLVGLAADLAAGESAAGARAFSRRALPLVAVGVASGAALAADHAVGGAYPDGLPWLGALGAKGLAVAFTLDAARRSRAALARLDAPDGREGLARAVERELAAVVPAIGLAAVLSQLPTP